MLFNSYAFLFAFLPLTLGIYALLHRLSLRGAARAWLIAASWFFYAYWAPKYLLLLLATLFVNYGLGRLLAQRPRRWLLVTGIALNLALLGYLKYANFLVENLALLLESDFAIARIVLPLGISFHTFQQIAYLVDVNRKETVEHDFSDYCLFVCFFPQLLAGPLVRDNEMLHQFAPGTYRMRADDMSVGMTLFLIGLFKKIVLADNVTPFATAVFSAADGGEPIAFMEAWIGALAYALQIYFDFSGYTDMAIGLARMFGIVLPANFDSPYKSRNISEFWRRWHMTLSRFLRDFLYIPLGGNRRGPVRRYVNLMVTMLLGGLWHGAGWNFVIWGGLHGAYLVVHQLFQGWRERRASGSRPEGTGISLAGHAGAALTFLCVLVAWVLFRAETLDGAQTILATMFGVHGIAWDTTLVVKREALAWIAPLLAVAYVLPNSQQLLEPYRPVLAPRSPSSREPLTWPRIQWSPSPRWACAAVVVGATVLWQLSKVSEFIYFQF